jgi:hypothetical protein
VLSPFSEWLIFGRISGEAQSSSFVTFVIHTCGTL